MFRAISRHRDSRSSALAAIYRDPAVIRHHPPIKSPAVLHGGSSSAVIPQATPLAPAERLAKYSRKVEQRGYLGLMATIGLVAFVVFEFSVFFFDVASPLHFTFIPQLLARLSADDRKRLVSVLAKNDSLPEDLGSEDPYLIQRNFVRGKPLLFPIAVRAATAEEALGLIKLGFGAVELSDRRKELNVKADDLTRHALVGVRINEEHVEEIADLLQSFDWVTLDIADDGVLDTLSTRNLREGAIFLHLQCPPSPKILKFISAHSLVSGVLVSDYADIDVWGKLASEGQLGKNFRIIAPLVGRATPVIAAGASMLLAEEVADFRVARKAKGELTHSLIAGGYYDVEALIGSKWRAKTDRELLAEKNKKRF